MAPHTFAGASRTRHPESAKLEAEGAKEPSRPERNRSRVDVTARESVLDVLWNGPKEGSAQTDIRKPVRRSPSIRMSLGLHSLRCVAALAK